MVDERHRVLNRRVASIAVPALGALAAEPLYVLVDTAIVGRLGTNALGGLAVATSVLTTIAWMLGFLSTIVTTNVAATGADEETQAARIVDALALALGLGVMLGAVIAAFARPLASAVGAHGPVLTNAVTYLRISAIGVPALLVAFVGHGELRGRERNRRSLAIVGVANVLNVGLEVVFVYGWHLGVAGSAWGTVIVQVLAGLWFTASLVRRVRVAPGARRPDRRAVLGLLGDGLRLGVRTAAIVGVFLIATAAAARMGAVRLAAHQITYQLFTLLALGLDALALAGQVIVATAIGAGRFEEGAHASRHLVRVALRWGLLAGAVVVATSGLLPRVFTADAAVRHAAIGPLVLLGVLTVPGAVAFLFDGVYLGTSDYGWMQRGTLLASVTFFPFAVVAFAVPRLGLVFLWSALVVWMTARAVLQHWWFRSGRWTAAAHGG